LEEKGIPLTESKIEYKEVHDISVFLEKLEKVISNKSKFEANKWAKYVSKEVNLI